MSNIPIHHVEKVAPQAPTKKESNDVSTELVDKFKNLLSIGNKDLTQATSSAALGSDSDLIKKMAPTDPAMAEKMGQNMSPLAILESQKSISKAVVEVDLVAKIAGSLSQSINKLASMQ
ncbi:EscI/YscI/HrpB family type III secretion system inner rod protein [Parashewanella spongiae]|uniref:EscI/YscI/HrpB family type III secretion system inner rod protein n=1 Tax=Parashewanella spongiae TaxID=342950 RepID=A0A3A6TWU8_9GAMM|nr:type III secretion system inner rod subunit SctI [Parashewanella spongiae]MCL1076961.1 type III secretion system inner rod subunit SctI [Parashewanella spongiae]RJY18923.1 EscI/YscI/HrpB family type III secretion system inner rod protein [Parashewanella spongiae]